MVKYPLKFVQVSVIKKNLQLSILSFPADDNYVFESLVPLQYESHAGEDVPVYATGPMSHLVRSTFEQNAIAHVMAYAACLGEHKYNAHCGKEEPPSEKPTEQPSGAWRIHHNNVTSAVIIFSVFHLVIYSDIIC